MLVTIYLLRHTEIAVDHGCHIYYIGQVKVKVYPERVISREKVELVHHILHWLIFKYKQAGETWKVESCIRGNHK